MTTPRQATEGLADATSDPSCLRTSRLGCPSRLSTTNPSTWIESEAYFVDGPATRTFVMPTLPSTNPSGRRATMWATREETRKRRGRSTRGRPACPSRGSSTPSLPSSGSLCFGLGTILLSRSCLGTSLTRHRNMFLAASPYFASRFTARPSIANTFQSAILTVSTITNLAVTLLLTNLQRAAHYPNRIKLALVVNTAAFALLTLSTSLFRDVGPEVYLAFLLVDVCFAALATGLFQNGAFAFAASFGRPEYTQAIMAGQGVAGVLPSLAQIISVLIIPPGQDDDAADDTIGTSAFIYFLTAVAVSIVTLLSFFPLAKRYEALAESRKVATAEQPSRKVVGLATLFRKLHWLAGSATICFVVTMFFPVFTVKILSVRPPPRNRLFDPPVFIPLSFFWWNLGDLVGRMCTMGEFNASMRRRPLILFLFGIARLAFLPLYMLCNLHGQGAVVSSDAFYLVLVQLPFGLSNGWLASNAMMAAAENVDETEREAAGGFMGLCLVAGLAIGSVLSFTAAGI